MSAIECFEAVEASLWDRTRACFEGLEDPRAERGKRHRLADVLLLALLGMICGADNADELAAWAEDNEEWLSEWFAFEHGTPSQDTFLRVAAALDPAHLREAFTRFLEVLAPQARGHVAIDGKTLRGSFDTATGSGAIHMVSAWMSDLGLVLGQMKTEAKTNEITTIPALLERLRLKGCTVTIDAAGCQKAIAADIVKQQADYILAAKDNQPTLHEDIRTVIREGMDERRRSADEIPRPRLQVFEDVDSGHGRIEKRTAYVSSDLQWMRTAEEWPGLAAVGVVVSEVTHELSGKQTRDERAFILSNANTSAQQFLAYTRAHWGIENSLHWVLDMTFGEDAARVRSGFAAEILAIIRHAALNLLRRDKTYPKSLNLKRRRCNARRDYLLTVIGATATT